MIDIGVNLTPKLFQTKNPSSQEAELAKFVTQCQSERLSAMIAIGTSVKESLRAALQARQYPGYIFATAGVHPHDAKHLDGAGKKELEQLIQSPEVVAVGEMGLDFNRNFSPPEIQESVFAFQLDLNRTDQKPLYLHERDATSRQIEIMQAHRNCFTSGVMHCFTGNKDTLKRYLDLGLHIGITGWVCDERRGVDLVEAVKYIPADRLLAETDSPYLLPRTLRPKPRHGRNQPWYVREVIRRIAEIRGVNIEEMTAVTQSNAKALFNLNIASPIIKPKEPVYDD